MPLLAGLLITLFTALVGWFARFVTLKIALAAAAIAIFAALTIALVGVISGLLAGLTLTFPSHPGFAIGAWVAVPDNTPLCIAAYLASDAAIALYHWNVTNLRLTAYVT